VDNYNHSLLKGDPVDTLHITSIQAPGADDLPEMLAVILSDRLGISVLFDRALPWRERLARLDRGAIQLGWLCGTPYVWRADLLRPEITLLAAPVMDGPRYGGKPVYFSEVVVRAESRFRRFEDLKGTRWGYNEPNSYSGYWVVRYQLARLGIYRGFFGKVVEAGSHERALKLILNHRIDWAAIDCTVLEEKFRQDPSLTDQLRVVKTFGPNPIPPWVAHRSVPGGLLERLRDAFLSLHESEDGQIVLRRLHMARFVSVGDADYNPIRRMFLDGLEVRLD
jgi:phosphonate transport system substrate-binding protein